MSKTFLTQIDATAGVTVSGGNLTLTTYIDLSKNELRNALVQNLGSDPASPAEGQIYYNSGAGVKALKYYNGTKFATVVTTDTMDAANLTGTIPGTVLGNSSLYIGTTQVALNRSSASLSLAGISGLTMTGAIAMGSNKITGLAAASANGDAVRYDEFSSVESTANAALPKAGGTMTGAIAMGTNKITGLGAATANGDAVRYNEFSTVETTANAALPKTGGTMSGAIAMGSNKITGLTDGSSTNDAVNKGQLDSVSTVANAALPKAGGTMTGTLTMSGATIAMGNNKITGLAEPSASTDATTKNYVDAAITASSMGLDVKASVRAASTASVSVTYNATGGSSNRGQITDAPDTLDGVSLAKDDRILLKNQSTGAQNGIYVVSTLGTGSNGVWDRASDFDTDAEVTANAFVFVEEGTANYDSGWVLTTNNPITIGGASGTSLSWTQFSGAGALTAGSGLTQTGSTIDVGAGTGITVSSDAVAVDRSTNGAKVALIYTASIGDGAATSYTVTHNLGSKDVGVTLYDNNSPYAEVVADVEHTSTSAVTVKFASAPSSDRYRVVVFG